MTRRALVLSLALLAWPSVIHAQLARIEVAEAPVLFECSKDHLCFRVTLQGFGRDEKPFPLSTSPTGYRVARRERAEPSARVFFVEPASEEGGPTVATLTMVLVDLSGSMLVPMDSSRRTGDRRFDVAKRVLRQFVGETTVRPGVDRFAIAGFHGRGVLTGIRRAPFVDSKDAALAQVDALNEPERRNNTALYSAVTAALERLKDEQRGTSASARLVVFTDGKNDVREGDDPDLLGNNALGGVAASVQESGLDVTTIGFGDATASSFDESALRRIASSSSRYSFAGNQAELEGVFKRYQVLQANKAFVWVANVAGTVDSLTGGNVTLQVGVDGLETAAEREKPWKSPRVGQATPLALTNAGVQEAFVKCCLDPVWPPPWLVRLLVFTGLAAVLAVAWFAVPRFVWPMSYIPKPVIDRPRSQPRSRSSGGPASSVSVPAGSRRRPEPPAPQADSSITAGPQGGPPSRDPRSRLAPSSPRPSPKERVEPPPREAGDATVYIPRAKKYEKDV